ncbi:HAD family hydrolase [Deinococcus sp. Marseille-Q6407]|uniref:HAD family hydrolase n=1 Tax=Deinococcus sp. Marseille-Q6407 TaxID=2969223 RepID=UPI0021C121F0|nr:HAD family phosphatase [Deinococcus sp. Marseille-Q6407]
MTAAGFAGVIFDFDGVLVDSEGIAYDAWVGAMGEAGERIGKQALMDAGNGLTNAMLLDWLREEHGWEPPAGFSDDLSRRFAQAFGPGAMILGAAETLAGLRAAGVPVALATNSSQEEMVFKLGEVGLSEGFGKHAYNPSHVGGRAKPAPDLYRHAATALGLRPQQCLVLEDSLVGVRAAVAAGCTVWGLTATHHDPALAGELLAAGAQRTLSSHAEVQAALGL